MARVKLKPLAQWARERGLPYSTAHKMLREGKIQAERVGEWWMVREEVTEEGPAQGRVLTLFTHAGGAGKTSLTRDLGYEMASRGKRVLLVDMDPQANLSAWLGAEEVAEGETALAVFEGRTMPKPRAVLPNLDLLPAQVELARAEVVLSREPHNAFALRGALNELREVYDLILVDSLPSLGPLAVAAALAGDGLVVPVELSRKGLQAFRTVVQVARGYGISLQRMRLWVGRSFVRLVVPTHAEGTARDREVLHTLREVLDGAVPVAQPLVRRPAVYREAQAKGVPVQLVGGEEVVRELQALGDLVEDIFRKEEVGA
ncbi:ParA family protein [Thermus tengchongensis]|uniref:ParA family protein n=1 Tax=Thermus tengchongensis TaxID=1214928 RepID=UPI00056FD92D|nr:ParA family protein [Thermus tengchongensis]